MTIPMDPRFFFLLAVVNCSCTCSRVKSTTIRVLANSGSTILNRSDRQRRYTSQRVGIVSPIDLI